jgi:hypothetical protein
MLSWRGSEHREWGACVFDRNERSATARQAAIERVPHRAAPAYNNIIMRISPVCEFDEYVGVTALGCTPAHEILAAQFV